MDETDCECTGVEGCDAAAYGNDDRLAGDVAGTYPDLAAADELPATEYPLSCHVFRPPLSCMLISSTRWSSSSSLRRISSSTVGGAGSGVCSNLKPVEVRVSGGTRTRRGGWGGEWKKGRGYGGGRPQRTLSLETSIAILHDPQRRVLFKLGRPHRHQRQRAVLHFLMRSLCPKSTSLAHARLLCSYGVNSPAT